MKWLQVKDVTGRNVAVNLNNVFKIIENKLIDPTKHEDEYTAFFSTGGEDAHVIRGHWLETILDQIVDMDVEHPNNWVDEIKLEEE